MSAIPTKSRELVHERDEMRCGRCGGRGTEISHRRPRSVADEHQHCPCNLIYACRDCHAWAHANPTDAQIERFTLSRMTADPSKIPVLMWHGLTLLDCQGGMTDAV